MTALTPQMEKWAGLFGRSYTDRNDYGSLDELEASYRAKHGLSRTELNDAFVGPLDREIRILEVGSNVGYQLLCLQQMGFEHLYGIELQPYAVEKAKHLTQHINIIQGSAFDIPYKDGYFDLVFTSGVLIHINPGDLPQALREIARCTNRYIWGFEYFAPQMTEVAYRGNSALMWKGNYPQIYRAQFSELSLVKQQMVPYLADDNVDVMYLLEKEVVR